MNDINNSMPYCGLMLYIKIQQQQAYMKQKKEKKKLVQ